MFSSKWTETVSLFEAYNPTGFSFSCKKILEKYKRSRKPQIFDNDQTVFVDTCFYLRCFQWRNKEILTSNTENPGHSSTSSYMCDSTSDYMLSKVFLKMENGSGYVLILNTVEIFIFKNVLRVYSFLCIRRHCLPAISSQAVYY